VAGSIGRTAAGAPELLQLRLLPADLHGIGETATGWGDGGVASAELPLAGAFDAQLLADGVAAGFDFPFSANPRIDHAFMAPLTLIRPEMDIPVVPVFQNANTEPSPPLWRCAELGDLLRDVIAPRPVAERVVVSGTGGLSHVVGTPEMGRINADFDETFLQNVQTGDLGSILAMKTADVLAEAAGTGTPCAPVRDVSSASTRPT
jgi:protocatechuate 4,5-dioxygenase beta chain/2'-carboxy-2,3-dihydroxybiphenyl 1,2-dioxygenase large subunit/2'-aminobiphenyl-2,3-diol 1,2-dioxygenase large subunit